MVNERWMCPYSDAIGPQLQHFQVGHVIKVGNGGDLIVKQEELGDLSEPVQSLNFSQDIKGYVQLPVNHRHMDHNLFKTKHNNTCKIKTCPHTLEMSFI